MLEQTREKKLGWSTITASGRRNMVNALYHEMGKGFVSRKKAGRGCGSIFPHMFCRPAARPTGGYTRIVGQV
jgi:hypothetical protein